MAIVRNKFLVDSEGRILRTINKEIFLTADIAKIPPTVEELRKAVSTYVGSPIFKLYLLNPDESIKEDISEYVIEDSLSYTHEMKSGQRSSLSVSLVNQNNEWFPNPVNSKIWAGAKFKYYMGLLCGDDIYWFPRGVYVINDPSYSYKAGEKTVSLQLSDKFALIDGTLGGTTETDYKIPLQSSIKGAIESLLKLDTGNGTPFDVKPIIFPTKYLGNKTPYTIEYNPSQNIGELILEFAEILSCDIYYNEEGYLTLEPADELLAVGNKPVIWQFDEKSMQYTDVTYDVKYTEMINKVTVVGANVNAYVFKHTAVNTNPQSPSNINMSPIHFKYISDSQIYSDDLCRQRAEYELQKGMIFPLSQKFTSVYIPFLQAGNLINWTDSEQGFNNEKFLITSLSVDSKGRMTLMNTNIRELPFNG